MDRTLQLISPLEFVPARARGASDALALPRRTPVLLRCLGAHDDAGFVQCVVIASDEAGCRVRIDRGASLNEGARLEMICFGDDSGPWRMEASLGPRPRSSDRTTIELRMTGTVTRVEQRQAYRVCVTGLGMTMRIAGAGLAQVLDASVDGLSVVSAIPLPVDEQRVVTLQYGDQMVSGAMVVRNCTMRSDGHYRLGLEAVQDQTELRRQLQSLAMAVQREQIRRLTERGVEESAGTGPRPPFTVVPVENNAASLQPLHAGAMRGFHERRAHPRLPWKRDLTIEVEDQSGVRTLQVKTIDVSCGGFGFYSRAYLHVGTIVRSVISIRDQRRPIVGLVRYCQVVGGFMHRVGVQFIRDNSTDSAPATGDGAETRLN